MNRTNSFVSALKWWPLHQANNGSPNKTSFGSSVAVQKLRESKWFGPEEQRILCAVVECGFIVEIRGGSDENDDSWFGIVICKTAKVIWRYYDYKKKENFNDTNKAKPETIEIFSVKILKNGGFKMIKLSLEDIWKNDMIIRINNFSDREKEPHSEKDIRNQVNFARKVKQNLWHNSKHFVYWCRYGNRQQDIRRRQMSECVKWGSVGMNAGMLLVMNKQKSYSTSK